MPGLEDLFKITGDVMPIYVKYVIFVNNLNYNVLITANERENCFTLPTKLHQ